MFGGISKRLEHVDIWDVFLYQASFNFLVTAEGQPGGKNPARKDNNHPMVSTESSGIYGHFISGNLLHNYGKSP